VLYNKHWWFIKVLVATATQNLSARISRYARYST